MAENRAINKNFGVVLFDDPKQPSSGWRAMAGDKTAVRIQSPDELSTGTIWLTNIDYENFFRASDIWRRSNLRHEGYLVVKIANILKEWNIDPGRPGQQSELSPNFICVFVSQCFHRVMHAAFRLIRQVDPRLTMDRAFMGQTLRDDLRIVLPPLDYPKAEAASFMKADKSYQEFTQCTSTRSVRDAASLMVRRPRALHAMEMLQVPIPVGPFEFVARKNFRNFGTDIVDFLKTTDKPCMIELDMEGIDPDVGPVYGFSNSTNKAAKQSRTWVPHNEFQALSRYASLTIRSFYMGREYGSLVTKLPDAVQEFLTDKTLDTSWTAGIIAETLWRAATLKESAAQAGKPTDGEDRAGTSWEGAWIRGQDKISMFIPAYELHKRNYVVSSYGLGWVNARVTEEMRNDFLSDSLSLGLVPAMQDIPDRLFDRDVPIPWGGDQRSRAYAQFQATKNVKMSWNMDKLPNIAPAERKPFIKKMMQVASEQGW